MSKVRVILADHDRNSIDNNENIVERTVMGVRQHQKFEASNYNNDIAVIELNEPVDFGDKIKPVCLPTTSKYYFHYSYVTKLKAVNIVAGFQAE